MNKKLQETFSVLQTQETSEHNRGPLSVHLFIYKVKPKYENIKLK